MKFSWNHFFILAEQFLDINQAKIAEYLGVHPSTISNLKNGKQPRFKMSGKELYTKLFDPENDIIYNHLQTRNTDELLSELKEVIQQTDCAYLTENVEDNSYKAFVIGLIDLVKGNQPTRSLKQQEDDNAIIQNDLDPLPSPLPDFTEDIDDFNESKISIPHKYNASQYKVCLYCKNWKCNNQFAHTCKSGAYGTCMKYGIKTLSTSHKCCKDFLLNEGKITLDLLGNGFKI